jgi:hypothetical protein
MTRRLMTAVLLLAVPVWAQAPIIDPALAKSWAESDAAVTAEVQAALKALQQTAEYQAYEAILKTQRALRLTLDKQVKAVEPRAGWDLTAGRLVLPAKDAGAARAPAGAR